MNAEINSLLRLTIMLIFETSKFSTLMWEQYQDGNLLGKCLLIQDVTEIPRTRTRSNVLLLALFHPTPRESKQLDPPSDAAEPPPLQQPSLRSNPVQGFAILLWNRRWRRGANHCRGFAGEVLPFDQELAFPPQKWGIEYSSARPPFFFSKMGNIRMVKESSADINRFLRPKELEYMMTSRNHDGRPSVLMMELNPGIRK